MAVVYIFGAGASKPEGAPLIADFMGVGYDNYLQSNKEDNKKIWKFLNDYFGKDPKNSLEAIDSYPTIDEITTLVDYAINNQISLSSKHTVVELYDIKKELSFLIANTVEKSIKKNDIHNYFIGKLVKKKKQVNIISLNYDTLLDDAIIENYKKGTYEKINYGMNGDLTTTPKFNLLKLHGSLNWALCPFCQSIKIQKNIISDIMQGCSSGCLECNNNYWEPVIITPTLLKSYNIQMLNNVWLAASKAIAKSDTLVFVGYSLALSDYPIINLIKNSVSQRNILKKVIIIGVESDKEKIGDRFKKIFGRNIEIQFDGSGFNGQTYWD